MYYKFSLQKYKKNVIRRTIIMDFILIYHGSFF